MMKRIYIHGLGQTAHSWDKVIEASDNRDGIVCPDLPGLIGDKETTYENLYAAFSKMCDAKDEELILCGLSLGGVLALNYAVEHAEKVKALVLIATPYKMPKAALMLQNIVFRFMPDSGFKGIGFTKRDFIKLCKSMMELDFTDELHKITCPALVVCGENDTANMKASVKMADILQDADMQTVKGAAHEVNAQAPEALSQILEDFYKTKVLQDSTQVNM